jgi:hypothetical protein
MRRPWSVSVVLFLALLALVPSKACGCLESYQLSPIRMLFALQLSLVLLAACVAVVGTRAKWGTVAALVALLSCIAAMLLATTSPTAGVAALLLPPLGLALLVCIRRLLAQRRNRAGLTLRSSRPPSAAAELKRWAS